MCQQIVRKKSYVEKAHNLSIILLLMTSKKRLNNAPVLIGSILIRYIIEMNSALTIIELVVLENKGTTLCTCFSCHFVFLVVQIAVFCYVIAAGVDFIHRR